MCAEKYLFGLEYTGGNACGPFLHTFMFEIVYFQLIIALLILGLSYFRARVTSKVFLNSQIQILRLKPRVVKCFMETCKVNLSRRMGNIKIRVALKKKEPLSGQWYSKE